MNGHTPGPWIVSADGCEEERTFRFLVGGPHFGPGEKAQAVDDARLIAAAPAMYGRLELTAGVIEELYREGAFRRLETGSDREREALALLLRIVETHNAAIAAAEGRE